DDLFGSPGAHVYYAFNDSFAFRLGSGNDTVYASPNIYGPQTIDGGAGNDTLDLALAGMGGYSLSGSIASGTVTPVNTYHVPLSWNNFEQRNIDDVAPTVLSSSFVYDAPIQSIDVQFSEDVSGGFGYLDLENLTTGTRFTDLALSYDLATN